MSICGYEERMGAGIRQFSEGLIAAIGAKANNHGVSLVAQVAIEEDQMEILLAHLRSRQGTLAGVGEDLLTAFIGIVLLARGLLGFHESRADGGSAARNAELLIELLMQFEHAYEAQPTDASHFQRTRAAWEDVLPSLTEPHIQDGSSQAA